MRNMPTVVDTPPRSCGECSACCTVLGVRDLEPPKPDYVACSDCRPGGGCSRYTTRPPTCEGYQCLWLTGALGDDESTRPDRLGLVFDVYDTPADGGEPGIYARAVWPDAPREHEELLFTLAAKLLIVVIYDAKRRGLIGPEHRLAAFRRLLAART